MKEQERAEVIAAIQQLREMGWTLKSIGLGIGVGVSHVCNLSQGLAGTTQRKARKLLRLRDKAVGKVSEEGQGSVSGIVAVEIALTSLEHHLEEATGSALHRATMLDRHLTALTEIRQELL